MCELQCLCCMVCYIWFVFVQLLENYDVVYCILMEDFLCCILWFLGELLIMLILVDCGQDMFNFKFINNCVVYGMIYYLLIVCLMIGVLVMVREYFFYE